MTRATVERFESRQSHGKKKRRDTKTRGRKLEKGHGKYFAAFRWDLSPAGRHFGHSRRRRRISAGRASCCKLGWLARGGRGTNLIDLRHRDEKVRAASDRFRKSKQRLEQVLTSYEREREREEGKEKERQTDHHRASAAATGQRGNKTRLRSTTRERERDSKTTGQGRDDGRATEK